MNRPIKIESAPREVIENTLLAALNDVAKVAIIVDAGDLELLILSLHHAPIGWETERKRLAIDMTRLQAAAFGPGPEATEAREPRKA